jgi:hypothetical protein
MLKAVPLKLNLPLLKVNLHQVEKEAHLLIQHRKKRNLRLKKKLKLSA